MTLDRIWRWSRPWEDWYRRALPAYWIFLFSCTHMPRPEIPGHGSDKVVHCIVFGVLTFFFWRFAESFERPQTRWFVWKALAILAAYAWLDEYLQQFVNRSTSFGDWIANMIGIVTVLTILEVRRRMTTRRHVLPE